MKVTVKITDNQGKEQMLTIEYEKKLTLSTDETVEFVDEIGHETEKKRKRALYKNAIMDVNANGYIVPSDVPYADYLESSDEILLDVIEKITGKDGVEITDKEAWRKKLKERDYKKIKGQIDKMIVVMANEVAEGKKNS